MSDLILRTRLQILRRNLETVANVGKHVADNRDGLRRLTGFWCNAEPKFLLQTIDNQVSTILNNEGLLPPVLRTSVERIQEDLEKLQVILAFEEITEIVRPMTKRADGLGDEVLRRPMESYLQSSAERKLHSLDDLEKRHAEDLNDPDHEGTADKDAWAAYLKLLPEAEAIFAEYVDFLGGLALRDSGYDEGICQLADELLRAILRKDKARSKDIDDRWNSFTVPANHEVLDATVARIIRVGFPEWSIWALPLTAHGLFTVLLANDDMYRERGQEVGADADPRVAVLLADAMATYVMGPAYAGAVLLFRLDPRGSANRPTRDASFNELRARVVFRTLDMLGADACGDFRRALGDAWDAALDRTAEVRPLAEETELRRAGADPAALDQQAGRVAGDLADDDLGAIVALAASVLSGKEFGEDAWQSFTRWAEDLINRRDLDPSLVDNTSDPLRQLLTAAWIARVMRRHDPAELTSMTYKHWTSLESLHPTAHPGAATLRRAPRKATERTHW